MSTLSKYGFSGTCMLAIHLLRTKMFYAPARLIRFPFEIRNKKFITIGKGFTTGKYCRLEAHPVNNNQKACITIGKNVQFNDSVHIVGSIGVTIGNNVLFASKIFVSDLNHGSYSGDKQDDPHLPPQQRLLHSNPVVIADNVWLGEFVSVLPGVTIGEGSIIGTMSVVAKNIPPYCIAVGAPAKVVKQYNFSTHKWEKVI